MLHSNFNIICHATTYKSLRCDFRLNQTPTQRGNCLVQSMAGARTQPPTAYVTVSAQRLGVISLYAHRCKCIYICMVYAHIQVRSDKYLASSHDRALWLEQFNIVLVQYILLNGYCQNLTCRNRSFVLTAYGSGSRILQIYKKKAKRSVVYLLFQERAT